MSRSDEKVLPREEYQRTAQRGQSEVSCELRREGKKGGETARTGGLFLGCPGAVPQPRHLQSTKKSDIKMSIALVPTEDPRGGGNLFLAGSA